VAVVLFDGVHTDELAAAVAEVAEFEGFLGRQRPDGGGDDLAEMGQEGGVDGVGLGELSGAFGEVADLAGVDDDGGQAGGEQGADGGLLIRAGRLEDDPFGREGTHPGDELVDAGGRVVEAFGDGGGSDVGVEEIFADVDADQETAHQKDSRIHEGGTRTHGFPVRAGECGVFPQ
jgi:hypothetical protein